jgi:queuine tRNA-ribosyltransferase
MFNFTILSRYKKARTAIFTTPHGNLHTPELAIVATDAEIRGIPKEMLSKLPVKLTISNTFHTFTKGLIPKIKKAGGLNKYMNYKNVTMTDSGGFQVFSLGFGKVHRVGKVASIFPSQNKKEKGLIITRDQDNLLHITEKGVMFNYDGKLLLITPEDSIAIQEQLGADIVFSFDECTSPLNSYDYTKKAMERTHRWFKRCIKQLKVESGNWKVEIEDRNSKLENPTSNLQPQNPASTIHSLPSKLSQALFAVVQGGMFENLRIESAKFMAKQPVPGYGIGGSLGRTKEDMYQVLDWTIPYLPDEKPRHLLGIGQIRDIFEGVERGVDLFDCVIPTREARHKVLYTKKGKINVRKMRTVHEVIEKGCSCLACSNNLKLDELYKLYKLKDPFAFLYSTAHNIQFYSDLMREIRESINSSRFDKLKNEYCKYY